MLFLAAALLGASGISAAPTPNDTYPLTTVPGTKPWNPVEPLQQRIAIINATAMSISWNTYGPLNDTEAVVEYGFDPLSLEYTAGSVQTTFETSRTYSHHATLTNLQPKTVYHYRVAHTNCFGCSYIPTYTFKTPREPGCEEPYTIAVLADMGLMGPDGLTNSTGVGAGGALGDDETNTIQALTELRDDFDSIIHIGDLAYADYFLKETINGFFGNSSSALRPNKTEAVEKYELLNEEFYDQLTSLTAYKPYMVAVGNHESNCVNGNTKSLITNITYTTDYCMPGQTNFTAYAEHWRMPGKAGSESQNFWYSFDDGMVHYVVYDTETDFGKGLYAPDEVGGTGKQMNGPRGYVGEQIEFLKADLAAVNRTATPWVLAFGHRPFYNGIGDALCKPCAKAFEDVLYQGGVDVVMNGHNHVYSQSWPVYKNETQKTLDNPSFPIHITNGAGGHYDGLDKNSNPLPDQIAVGIDGVYGWSRVHFANRTHMRHEFIASRNNTILDTFWLYKEH